MTKLRKEKIDKSKILRFCSFSIIIVSLLLITHSLISKHSIDTENKIKIEEFFETQETQKTDEIEIQEEIKITSKKENYLAVLEIPKINLLRGFYSLSSKNNNVNKNIQMLEKSQTPNVNNSNLILASHSGNSNVSFFRNLYKLKNNDEAIIHYDNNKYIYSLVNTYEIEKNGKFTLSQNNEFTTLTLITCKPKTNLQLVFVFELKKTI